MYVVKTTSAGHSGLQLLSSYIWSLAVSVFLSITLNHDTVDSCWSNVVLWVWLDADLDYLINDKDLNISIWQLQYVSRKVSLIRNLDGFFTGNLFAGKCTSICKSYIYIIYFVQFSSCKKFCKLKKAHIISSILWKVNIMSKIILAFNDW